MDAVERGPLTEQAIESAADKSLVEFLAKFAIPEFSGRRDMYAYAFCDGGELASERAEAFLQAALKNLKDEIESARLEDEQSHGHEWNQYTNGVLHGLEYAAWIVQEAFGCTGDQCIVEPPE